MLENFMHIPFFNSADRQNREDFPRCPQCGLVGDRPHALTCIRCGASIPGAQGCTGCGRCRPGRGKKQGI